MKLLNEDLNYILRRLPKCVSKLMKDRGDSVMLAGGFIRACISGEKPSDVDLFSRSKDIAEACARRMSDDNKCRLIETEYAYTVAKASWLSIQFIHKWIYEKPEDVIPSFDFTIARAMVWHDGNEWQSLCDDRFYPDLAAKRLVYCCPDRIEEVGGSMLRVLKFYQKGYRIPLNSLSAVVARLITGIRFDEIGDSAEATYESTLSKVITGLLYEVDPNVDMTQVHS